jgi:hypothetical protein
MKSKRFSPNFRAIVQLKPGETCSWRRHFRGVTRNLIGQLDLWAANDPDRLVYAGLKAIVKATKRYKGEPYSRTAVLAALRSLRADKIVGKLVTCTRAGYGTTGFFVAEHDALCLRQGNKCVCLRTDAPLVWHSTPKSEHEIARLSEQERARLSEHLSEHPTALLDSPQEQESKKVKPENAPLTVLTAQTASTDSTLPTVPTAVAAQPSAVAPALKSRKGTAGDGCGLASEGVGVSKTKAEEKDLLWQEMRNHPDFPEEMLSAVPRQATEEKSRVLEQLKTYGVDVVVEAIEEWADERDMGLSGLRTKWRAWLDEGEPLLRMFAEEAKEYAEYLRQQKEKK